SYNRRYHRSGYVFQNRYQSILCDADNYLLELVRYIHLNPLKAKIVESLSALDHYRWTGHSGMLGRHRQPWQEVNALLGLFGERLSTARRRYHQFMEEGLQAGGTPDLSGGGLIRSYGGWELATSARKEHTLRIGDERILGDSDFVERALREDEIHFEKSVVRKRQGIDLETLISWVCKYVEVESEQLMQKGRSNALSLAKALICFWGVRELRLTTRQLGDRLGVSPAAVSKSSKRGRDYCLKHNIDIKDIE
ncbi:transposase, partial [Exilibacterium tricleocarpae]|uniref:transposase n=1 Tax=Exilibacterium tricleocarpae TaxID=2591008 RepID=UPI0015D2A18C